MPTTCSHKLALHSAESFFSNREAQNYSFGVLKEQRKSSGCVPHVLALVLMGSRDSPAIAPATV